MKIETAIKTLKQHNAWRRGEVNSATIECPTKLGIAIDTIINHYETNEAPINHAYAPKNYTQETINELNKFFKL